MTSYSGAQIAAVAILVVIILIFIGSICSGLMLNENLTSDDKLNTKTGAWPLVLSSIFYLLIIGVMIWSLWAGNNIGLWIGGIYLLIIVIFWIFVCIVAASAISTFGPEIMKQMSKSTVEFDECKV